MMYRFLWLMALCVCLDKPCPAQSVTAYQRLYTALGQMEADENRVARIENVVLRRDSATFALNSGTLYLCKPVEDRTCAAIFLGQGTFFFEPPIEVEQEQLTRFYRKPRLKEPFTLLFLVFADSTLKELKRAKVSFEKGQLPGDLQRRLRGCAKYLYEESTTDIDEAVALTLLNNESNGLFSAQFSKDGGEPMFVEINPFEAEEVRLMRQARGGIEGREPICQFHKSRDYSARLNLADKNKDALKVEHYVIDAHVSESMRFSAATEVRFTSLKNQSWMRFTLSSDLAVDSVKWGERERATFFRGKESSSLWIESQTPLAEAQRCSLRVYYHGDIIEEYRRNYIIKTGSIDWYPAYNGLQHTTFEMTFHTPAALDLVSAGVPVMRQKGKSETLSKWMMSQPSRNASFSLGEYVAVEVKEDSVPPVTVLMTKYIDADEGIRRRENLQQDVAQDVARSAEFYQKLYGRCLADRLTATEILYRHGEAFPGLIHLSVLTFAAPDRLGDDEIFRAHEVAHQWWGHGVDYKTYHDQWLSEAFAEYSGLCYLQAVHKDGDLFLNKLRRYKEEILSNRKGELFSTGQEAGPIWLGYRTNTSTTRGDYGLIIYKKGAWVLHMLRHLFLDIETGSEARYLAMMQEFYSTYKGKKASTEDFYRVVKKHAGEDMAWFFRQWVYGTKIPKYKFAYKVEETPDKQYKVTCRIRQENVPEDFQMLVPLKLEFSDNRVVKLRVLAQGKVPEFELPPLPQKPKAIVFNDGEAVLCEVEITGW